MRIVCFGSMKTTKELARELGLLRKRTLSSSGSNKYPSSSRQPFGYLIVLDFESTCWKEKKFQTQEIIEFPAVLLNTTTGDIESEFHYYVQPQEQPILSDFCHELTGITQEQVDEGIPLRLCLKKFSKWLESLCKDKGITFSPVLGQQSSSKAATFVTWSDWDLGVCLFNECRRKQLLKPSQLNSWIDLRATYRKFYNRRPQGLNGALQDLGITFEGREHSGLHDSRNTARLAWRMTRDGCILTTTKTLQLIGEASGKTELPTAVDSSRTNRGNGEHYNAVHKTIPTVQVLNSPSRSPCHKKRKTDTCVSPTKNPSHSRDIDKLVSSPRIARSKIPVRSPKSGDNRKTATTTKQSIVDQIYRDPSPEEIPTGNLLPRASDKKQLTMTGLRTRNNIIPCNNQQLNHTSTRNNTALKTPQGFKANPNVQGNISFKNPSNYSSFKTPIHVDHPQSRTSCCYLDSSKNSTGQENMTSISGDITPTNFSTKLSKGTISSMKVTPPLCRCGKRSKRRMAQTPGPNMGRFFFTCGAGSRQNNPQDKRKGCDYFKWESTLGIETNSRYNCSFQSSRSNTSLPFKQVGQKSRFSQRKSLGVRSATFKTPIR
ncbi:ERI1 exoribonuclease 2-like [Pecten maximus]|uniref:ERI1 exoribonuclease 2-like n=1 Tax=Pecten maximus TaxID=6579 RepID=UPI0014589751|nr:ERI1 exoribonuclease 2-like [Pecten maximus]